MRRCSHHHVEAEGFISTLSQPGLLFAQVSKVVATLREDASVGRAHKLASFAISGVQRKRCVLFVDVAVKQRVHFWFHLQQQLGISFSIL
jgi:hypothetical protein